ncbi:hypothetical protein BCR44DRAFT_1433804 [Catenaria anguillulae PL171]|uniref:Eukaryotic translation initiation factor 5B n=1 Tax=Catenaria anguillulae PL171 TaxID=765915 RepID=A0A1Y2HP48_9FUNG|nr:hypothetical protein BCR44DRAFT_1433804 [Catenaria anguillulae PL171]
MAKGKKGKKNQSWDDYDVEGADVAAPATDVPATAHNSTSPSSDPAAAAAAAPEPEPEPATTIAMTSVNPEEEWPEDDRKANKKGKKGANAKNKPTSTASAAASPPPVSSSSSSPEPSAANNVDQLDAPASVNPEDEWPEDDRKTNKKGKKGGAKNKPTPAPTPAPASDPTPQPTPDPAQADVDVDPLAALADEWPEDQPKPKKGAGGAKKAAKPEPAAATAAVADANDDDIDKRPLSKKEKEKLRKQRQKEQEKAKLDEAKRALEAEEAKEAAKKDKAAAAAAAAGAGGKKKAKPGAPIAALQKMLAAQRAAEEEAARLAEEERKREEEEARRKEEEEKAKEEAKRVKKEKERLKREQLRKEGKLLTKAQKEAQQRAALKLQQLIEAGVVVPALQEKQAGEAGAAQDAPKKKKIVYENKKKKKPVPAAAAAGSEETPAAAGSKSVGDYKLQRQREKEEAAAKALEAAKVQAEADAAAAAAAKAKPSSKSAAAPESDKDDDDDDVKDAWDASSDEEEEQAPAEDEDVKDAWDASSGDEDEQEDEPENKKPKAAAAAKGKAPAAPAAKGKSHAAAESTDEDDSESGSGSDWDDSDSDDDSDSEDEETEQERKRPRSPHASRLAARKKDDLRSPICCILGHVDTGKTKLLDKIRQTNVQEGEAGGITQQIGATYFPQDAIIKKTEVLKKQDLEIKVPGLLVIDTPGHESFTNLRSRGSSLCNIAILVVDIMHGLEPQTLESLNLLRQRKTPFIVALNKIDRIYGWDATPNGGFEASLAKQSKSVQKEYLDRLERTKLAFAEQGLNSEVYYKNRNMAKYVSLVPTSAITGEGIPDLLYLLCHLTQTRMSEKLMYVGELEATVLEVKVVEGLGTTIDVILSNGVLRENDRIVVCGLEGPIVTNVRALLTPQPLRELRVKSQYVHHKFIKAAMGVKISANGLEKAVAGSRLLVVTEDDDEELLKEEVMQDLANLEANIDKSGKGVWVQASTLGSLEALLSFLRDMKIPVSGINIGPVHKKDVVKASVMLDRAKEFAVMLCFDVKVEKEAQEMAEDVGVTVFTADIIYHLFDKFTAYHESLLEQKRKDAAPVAVFPCILSIIPGCVFNKRDPIIVGCDVKEGALRLGTPICVYGPPVAGVEGPGPLVKLGKVTGIEVNRKPVDIAKKGQYGGGVAVKIECPNYDTPKLVGRHFLEKEELMSHITRESIDVLKENFREEMSKEDWALVIKLKKRLNIQ